MVFFNKYERGILDIYLSRFDIICLNETHLTDLPSNFSKSSLGEYTFTSKKKSTTAKNLSSPFGGFHGLATFVHPKYKASLVPNTSCEAVLWVNVSSSCWDVIIGSYYFPCVTSKYYGGPFGPH